jgi:glycoprotein endo-alpha-1,2-mannosidase
MLQLKAMKVGVLILSWWAPGSFTDQTADLIMRKAKDNGIKVAFVIGLYPNRNITSVRRDVEYIHNNYANKSYYSYWKLKRFTNSYPRPTPTTPTSEAKARPVIYVFASGAIGDDRWATLIHPNREMYPNTLRGTDYDSIFLGHEHDPGKILDPGWDGLHKYGNVDDKIYTIHCDSSKVVETQFGSIYSASLGPGKWNPDDYIEGQTRPRNMKSRESGQTYITRWEAVKKTYASWASIVTFNEWHEGTHVEETDRDHSQPTSRPIEYKDFDPLNPNGYISLTKTYAGQFINRSLPTSCRN